MTTCVHDAKRRTDRWRRVATSPAARAYYDGLRIGLVHAEGAADALGEARARAYHAVETVDRGRYALACGYVDGTRWVTGPQHVGLLRLAILLRTDGSARAFAGVANADERTVRRWLAGERPISGVVLALLQREIEEPPIPK